MKMFIRRLVSALIQYPINHTLKKGLINTAAIVCIVAVTSASALESTVFNSASINGSTLEVLLNNGKVSIRPLNDETVEVFYQPQGIEQLPSFALPESKSTMIDVTLSERPAGLTFSLPELDIVMQRSPFKLQFKKGQTLLAQEEIGLFAYNTLRGFRFTLEDDEQMLGGGQRVLGMDRRGQRMPLYNKAHYGYSTESMQMYYSLPAVMSSKHYIIAFDNSASGFLDIGYTEPNVLQFEAVAGRTSYIFSAGDSALDVVQNFVSATGKQPLVPRWALGNFASRFGYKTQQETLDTIDKFIEQDFPVDAVVLDLYWFGPDIKGHMGNLNWHTPAFPEPEKMIAELKQKGVNTILITEPFILSTSSQWDSAVKHHALAKNLAGEPRKFDFYFGNTGLVDVFSPDAQDWFWKYYEALNQQGVAGWWGDLGEPEVHPGDSLHKLNGNWVTGDEIHNAYGHQWAKMVFERQQQMRPNERPFVMMRSGFLGSQRYGMIPWTGDVERSWNGLKPQVELALQMSVFGLAYTHSDLGGFAGGETFDPELYTRWMQYGVFQPVYRPHAQDHIPPEPVFHDKATQDLVRPFVKLRYQLLPYNYSLSMQNSLSGTPMMRPLFLTFENAEISRTDAYMWGDAFLVSPVVSPGVSEQIIRLPKGVWFNFYGSKQGTRPLYYEGGQDINIPAPINETPALVRAGSFIPMIDPIQNTQSYSSELLRVRHYSHPEASKSLYQMFDDDGKDPNSLSENAYQIITFDSQRNDSRLSLNAKVQGTYASAPKMRRVVFEIYGVDTKPESVIVDGNKVAFAPQSTTLDKQDAAHWDENNQLLRVSGRLRASVQLEIAL
jgi:oligosaccharide 4-alpha-D-glucosyltransferase